MAQEKKIRCQIALDTETTGLDFKSDRLIEIGCIKLDGRKDVRQLTDEFHCLINPEREVPEEAIAIHQITNEMLADKPKFAEVVDSFLEYVRDAELLIHNAEFDVNMINAELERVGRGRLEDYVAKITDTLALAKKMGNTVANLDALAAKFGLKFDAEERKRYGHNAMLDSRILVEVYLALTRQQGTMKLSVVSEAEAYGQIPPPEKLVVLRASDEELTAHEAMLDRVEKQSKGQCAWRKGSETAEQAE